MYELPQSLLVENPMKRYLINSPMLPSLVPDPDGGYTIYIQNASPGIEKESNWLPAPEGPVSGGAAAVLAETRCAQRSLEGAAARAGLTDRYRPPC